MYTTLGNMSDDKGNCFTKFICYGKNVVLAYRSLRECYNEIDRNGIEWPSRSVNWLKRPIRAVSRRLVYLIIRVIPNIVMEFRGYIVDK